MNPLSVISPAGRGRPLPSPSAYVMTAPCEKPPSTVRSEAMPELGCERVEPLGGERERLGEGRRVRVADLVDRVPVGASGRQVERAARSHAQQPASRVEMVEKREQVALVGAAAVEEHEQPVRIPGGRSDEVVQRVRGHVPQDVIYGGSAP